MTKNITEMTNTEFKKLTNGKFFSATFVKKDGSLRTYKGARVNVTKDSVGGANNVEHVSNLVTLYVPNEKRPRCTLNLKTVKAIASTGVNRISVGSITHSAKAVDFKLEI